MDKVKQVRKYNMGRCLDCHRGDYHNGLTEEVYGQKTVVPVTVNRLGVKKEDRNELTR